MTDPPNRKSPPNKPPVGPPEAANAQIMPNTEGTTNNNSQQQQPGRGVGPNPLLNAAVASAAASSSSSAAVDISITVLPPDPNPDAAGIQQLLESLPGGSHVRGLRLRLLAAEAGGARNFLQQGSSSMLPSSTGSASAAAFARGPARLLANLPGMVPASYDAGPNILHQYRYPELLSRDDQIQLRKAELRQRIIALQQRAKSASPPPRSRSPPAPAAPTQRRRWRSEQDVAELGMAGDDGNIWAVPQAIAPITTPTDQQQQAAASASGAPSQNQQQPRPWFYFEIL